MTPELEALARRAVGSPIWKWAPGMRLADGDLVIAISGDGLPIAASPAVLFGVPPSVRKDVLPDLTDAGTLGHIVTRLRNAYRDRLLRCEGYPDGWRVVLFDRASILGIGPTEGSALVNALEGQGGKP